jgi:tetratricopeptide (TPR) repeat protein
MVRNALWGVVFVVSLSAIPTRADAEEVAAESRDEAREHSERGQIQYNLGRFEEALGEYERAYELYPHPAFLFNLAQCHRELGDYDRAIFFFEGYLREQPEATNRELAEELLEECRQALSEQRQEEAPEITEGNEQEPVEAEPPPTPALEPTSELDATSVAATPPPEPPVQETRRPVYRSWWFWTILGVVVAGAVVGGTVGGLYASSPEVVDPSGSVGTVDWR